MLTDVRQTFGNLLTKETKGIFQMMMDSLNVANQSILESCPSDIIRVNQDNTIVQISSGLCNLFNIAENEILHCSGNLMPPVINQLLNSTASVEIEIDNNICYQFSHVFFDNNDDHTRTHVFTNITTVIDLYGENQRLIEEARQLQLIDVDTSLLTQRALLLVLESQLSQCRRYESPLSIIKINLNITDDNAELKLKLLKLTHLLKDQLRWSDMISRSATNQFTILLPKTDEYASLLLSNKLKSIIDHWEGDYPVNFGITEWNKNMSASELLDLCENTLNTRYNDGQDVA